MWWSFVFLATFPLLLLLFMLAFDGSLKRNTMLLDCFSCFWESANFSDDVSSSNSLASSLPRNASWSYFAFCSKAPWNYALLTFYWGDSNYFVMQALFAQFMIPVMCRFIIDFCQSYPKSIGCTAQCQQNYSTIVQAPKHSFKKNNNLFHGCKPKTSIRKN